MSQAAVKGLRDRLTTSTEDRLGRALSDLLDNPILTGAIGRAFDARERAAQAQELAMGALNLPSAADIERLTRRLRSLSQRLEGIEDGVDRLSRSLTAPKVEARLERIEEQLSELSRKVGTTVRKPAAARKSAAAKKSAAVKEPAAVKKPAAARKPAAAKMPAAVRKPAVPKKPAAPKKPSAAEHRRG